MTEQPKIKLMSDEEIVRLFPFSNSFSDEEIMQVRKSGMVVRDECEQRAAEKMKEVATIFKGARMTESKFKLICMGCNKLPSEIDEYRDAALDEGITPDEYVTQEEGTLNKNNGLFLCTDCYIARDMPLGICS